MRLVNQDGTVSAPLMEEKNPVLEVNYRGENLTFLASMRERILAAYLHHQTVCPLEEIEDITVWLSRYPHWEWEDFDWLVDRCLKKVNALEVVHERGFCFIPTDRSL